MRRLSSLKQQICLIPEEYQIYEIKSIGFGNKKQDFPLRGVFICIPRYRKSCCEIIIIAIVFSAALSYSCLILSRAATVFS